jgi:hypothetical protein
MRAIYERRRDLKILASILEGTSIDRCQGQASIAGKLLDNPCTAIAPLPRCPAGCMTRLVAVVFAI